MPAQTQVRRIEIKVDTKDAKGLQEIAQQMGYLSKTTKQLATDMGFLTNAFRGWLGYLGVREIVRMSDEMQNFSNKLKVVAQEGEDTAKTLLQINEIASRTNQSLVGTGDVYFRMASALKLAKASSEELLTLTESLINTFRVSGATTTETVNTIIQLSQAFSSGELRGQELRSVMEQNVVLAGALREKFGQDIYKKAADGAIKVTDVLEVLALNQEKISEQAKKLQPTIEQTVTKAFNQLSLAIGALNEKYQLSAAFAELVGFAINNLGSILVVAGGALTIWVTTLIPGLITGLANLKVAMIGFAAANPMLLLFTSLTVAGGLLYANWDKLMRGLSSLKASFLEFSASAEESLLKFRNSMAAAFGIDMQDQFNKTTKSIASMREEAKRIRNSLNTQQTEEKAIDPQAQFKSLIDKMKSIQGASDKIPKIKDILGELNRELDNGKINISEYQAKLINFELYKANRQFREGKTDVFAYHEQLKKLNIDELNRQLAAGAINLDAFNQGVASENIKVLDERLKAGKISLAEYNEELLKFEDKIRFGTALEAGVNSYIKSVGTLAEGIAKGIDQAFGHLEDNFIEFVKTGKFNFSQFTQSVLDDLTKIIVRATIIRPLAQGILSYGFGGGTTSEFSGATTGTGGNLGYMKTGGSIASSGSYMSPVSAKTTSFAPSSLPQKVSSVQPAYSPQATVINVIDNNNSDVQTSESTGPNGEKVIEILIQNKVKESFSSGAMDKVMSQSFGLKRKGS